MWGIVPAAGAGSRVQPLAFSKELLPVVGRRDRDVGTLVNGGLARGGRTRDVLAGEAYVDVGRLHGYREGIGLLDANPGGRACATER